MDGAAMNPFFGVIVDMGVDSTKVLKAEGTRTGGSLDRSATELAPMAESAQPRVIEF
jgi:hypothetical protein